MSSRLAESVCECMGPVFTALPAVGEWSSRGVFKWTG